jgi:hypothetical protein
MFGSLLWTLSTLASLPQVIKPDFNDLISQLSTSGIFDLHVTECNKLCWSVVNNTKVINLLFNGEINFPYIKLPLFNVSGLEFCATGTQITYWRNWLFQGHKGYTEVSCYSFGAETESRWCRDSMYRPYIYSLFLSYIPSLCSSLSVS